MYECYSENDLQQISGQLKKRYLLLGVILAVLLVPIVISAVARIEWLTVVLVFLFFAVSVFVIDLFCLPLHRYRKLITSALTGRTHTETLEFKEAEPDASVVEGVTCRGLIFLGAPDKHGTRDQRFYWDEELPLPAFHAGDQITLKYTGRNIIGYEL